MTRTTLDIDGPVLEEIKRMQKREGKALGRLVSELLTEALARHRREVAEGPVLEWTSKPMEARLDLEDKEALHRLLDRSG